MRDSSRLYVFKVKEALTACFLQYLAKVMKTKNVLAPHYLQGKNLLILFTGTPHVPLSDA